METVLRYKYRHIEKRADALYHEGAKQYFFDEFNHAGKGIQVKCVLNKLSVPHADPAVQADHQTGHDGNDAEAADLDQNQNDNLSENAPCGDGRERNKPRHADGGSRCKQRVYIGNCLPVCGTSGEGKEKASGQNGKQKAQHNSLGCG